jgi:hypothetical protein
MKNFTSILLILLTFISYSQTKLDTLVFNKLNEYRSSLSYIKASEIQYQYKFKKDEIYIKKQISRRKIKIDTVKVLTMVLKDSYNSDYKKIKDTIFYFSINQKDIIGGKVLNKLEFDGIAYKAAENHSNFLLDTNKLLLKKGRLFLTHEQPQNIFKSVQERYKYFGGYGLAFENAQIGKSRNFKDLNYENLEIIATDIINGWKESKYHNENMINIDINYSSVCTKFIEGSSGFKDLKNYTPLSTMVLIKK